MSKHTMCALLAVAVATATGCQPAEQGAPASSTAVPEPDVVLTADQTHNRWSSTIPPQATVPSGAIVEVFTAEASDGQFDVGSSSADVAALDFDPIHPLTGPVAVEGAVRLSTFDTRGRASRAVTAAAGD